MKNIKSGVENSPVNKPIMSGDNLHGKQPIKFYSEEMTLTKIELLERQLSLGEKVSNLDEKHKEWSRKLSI